MSEPHFVLIVEDDPAVAEFLQLALRAMGHEAAVAMDGQQAIDMASERAPQFVLLDALLPKMDGFAVLRELRKMLPQVPIVMMSGIYQKRSYVQDAVDLGAREYLFKPLSVLKIWELAERYLGEVAPGARDPEGFAGTPLSARPLACVLAGLLEERSTGMIFVRGPEGTAILFVEDGRIIFGRSNDAQTRLDRVLASMGKLTTDALRQAKQLLDRAKGRARLGDLLVEAKLLDPADLQAALDKQQRLHVMRPLAWTEGRSQFFESEAPRQETFKLDLDMEALVVWAARHLGTGAALEAWLPSSDKLLTAARDLELDTQRFSLSESELELLNLADGTRTLGALRAMGRLAQVDFDRLAAAFCSLGILGVKEGAEQPKRVAVAAANAPVAGAVSAHPPSRVLLGTSFAGKTGALRFENGKATRTVWFGDGCIAFANSNDPQDRLGQVLLRSNFVSSPQLRQALETSKAKPGSALGRILVDQGTLTLDDLHSALIAQVREVVAGLVCWQDGTFNFTSGPLPTQEIVPLALDPLDLVLDALRVTPFTALASVLPARNSKLRKTWQCFELAAEIELTQLEDRLLSELDANPQVGRLLDALGEDPQASLRAMHLGLSLGLIEEEPAAKIADDDASAQEASGSLADGFADEDFGNESFEAQAAKSGPPAVPEVDWEDESFDDESFGEETPAPAQAGRDTQEFGGEQSFAGLADETAMEGLIQAGSAADPQADFGAPATGGEDSFAGLGDEPALPGLIEPGSAGDPQAEFGGPGTGHEDSFAELGDEPALSGLIEPGSAQDPQADFAELAGIAGEASAKSDADLFAGELRGETGFTAALEAEPPMDFGLSADTGPVPDAGVELGSELAAAFADLEGPAPASSPSTATATMEPQLDLSLQTFFILLADHLRTHPGAIPDHLIAALPPELRERFGS